HRIGRTGRAGAKGDAISFYAEKDARLLQDIEKLTKQKFVPAELQGMVVRGSRERFSSDRGRRDEGRGRSERNGSSRDAHTGHSYTPGARSPYAAPRKQAADPFFTQPYEPSQSPAAQETPADSKSSIKPQKTKVAALLGGTPKR